MELFEVIRKRRSIRKYQQKPVENDKLEKILEAANQAPSAGNRQGYEIVVVEDSAIRLSLAKASLGQVFVASAPLSLVFCANEKRSSAKYGERGKGLYSLQDATIAAAYAQLAATELELATVWIGAFNDEEVKTAIGAPNHARPVAILPLGYAAENPGPTSRRTLSDLVHRGRY
jgi:nitroreductase